MTFADLTGPAADRRASLLVVPGNLGGSVEHFYHFLFGYLLPLIEHCHGMRGSHRFRVRDCGPMNHLFKELDGFIIETRPVHKVLEVVVGTMSGMAGMPRIMIPGFDGPHGYSAERFRRIRRIIARIYGHRIEEFVAKHAVAASERMVLVVDRAPPHPAYLDASGGVHSGGSARRSVPNMTEVFDTIARRHDALLVRLEDCSLFEQMYLFSRAWRVVGQHGAGLSHMIWARPDGGLLEFLPNPERVPHRKIKQAPYFSALCSTLGIAMCVLDQDSDHAPVDPDRALAALATLG